MLDFRDYIDGLELPDPDKGTYSVMELAVEHRHRYVLMTEKGAIILRRLPVRMRAIIMQSALHRYPARAQLIAEANALIPFVEGRDEADMSDEDRKKAERLADIGVELAMTDPSALGVIVSPALGSMDEFEDLFESLSDIDRLNLQKAIFDMVAERPPSEVDGTAETIGERYGLKVVQEDMLPVETVSQRAYWADRIRKESAEIERLGR